MIRRRNSKLQQRVILRTNFCKSIYSVCMYESPSSYILEQQALTYNARGYDISQQRFIFMTKVLDIFQNITIYNFFSKLILIILSIIIKIFLSETKIKYIYT